MSLHAEILATSLFNYFTHVAHTFLSFSFVLFLTMFCGVLACFSVPACSGMFPLSRKFCRGPVRF